MHEVQAIRDLGHELRITPQNFHLLPLCAEVIFTGQKIGHCSCSRSFPMRQELDVHLALPIFHELY